MPADQADLRGLGLVGQSPRLWTDGDLYSLHGSLLAEALKRVAYLLNRFFDNGNIINYKTTCFYDLQG